MGEKLKTELNSARESADLIRRRPPYAKKVLGLYAMSAYGTERGRLFRASYLPIRKIDDALDGDAPRIPDPLAYANNMRNGIENDELGETPEEQLLKYALRALEAKARPDDNPRCDFVRAIDAMIFDNTRAYQRRVLSANEIEKYYRDAFDPVINIALLSLDSNIRSRDIPSLSYGQGRVYSARDFAEDWERGIINVPNEVIASLGVSADSAFEEVGMNQGIVDWFHRSLLITRPGLIDARLLLGQLTEKSERSAKALCNGLISPMVKYIDSH